MRRLRRTSLRKKDSVRRIYLLPNLFTTGNIVSGILSIMFTIQGQMGAASYAILIGCLFDLLDGRIARLTKTGSSFGVNYDSLSDLVTFGVAPAAMLFRFFQGSHDNFLLMVVVIYPVCCALRLARFNVQASTTEKQGFKGLPTPAPAALIASIFLYLFLGEVPVISLEARFTAMAMQSLALALSGLMVSEIPYPVLGAGVLRRRHPFHYLVILLISVGFVIANPPLALLLIFSSYILWGPLHLLIVSLRSSSRLSDKTETP